jgi:AcrR family transcriptional regulator
MGPSTKKVDPRVKRTRHLLQQAFWELMHEKGFSAISIQDIAERATLNRATFYIHFDDKYQLLDSIVQEQFHQMVTKDLPLAPKWEESTLRILIRAVLEFFRAFHTCPTSASLNPLVKQAVQRELSQLFVTWLNQAPTSEPARSVSKELLAVTTSWAIFGAADQWSRETQAMSAEHMTDALLAVVTEGVASFTPGFVQE